MQFSIFLSNLCNCYQFTQILDKSKVPKVDLSSSFLGTKLFEPLSSQGPNIKSFLSRLLILLKERTWFFFFQAPCSQEFCFFSFHKAKKNREKRLRVTWNQVLIRVLLPSTFYFIFYFPLTLQLSSTWIQTKCVFSFPLLHNSIIPCDFWNNVDRRNGSIPSLLKRILNPGRGHDSPMSHH